MKLNIHNLAGYVSLALSQKHVPSSQFLGLPHLLREVSTLGLVELALD